MSDLERARIAYEAWRIDNLERGSVLLAWDDLPLQLRAEIAVWGTAVRVPATAPQIGVGE